MNATVKRIVELMFENTVMTEEVAAIKDEIMNNCQERYDDMIARGMTEDEAIAVVVDSLKGMEEVIAEYPKVKKEPEQHVDEGGEIDMTFSAASVKLADVHLISEDVTVVPCGDGMIHVVYDAKTMPYIRARVSGGVLSIDRDEEIAREHRRSGGVKQSVHVDGSQVRTDSLEGLFVSIGKLLDSVRVNISIGSMGDEHVRLLLPENWHGSLHAHSTGGDVDVRDVMLEDTSVQTTSGDVTIENCAAARVSVVCINGDVTVEQPDHPMEQVKIKTTSGDVRLSADKCADANVQTMSGDVELEGAYDLLNVSTVSGDVDVDGKFVVVRGKTISGDVDLNVQNDTLHSVDITTTSGDVGVSVADDSMSANVYTKTVSGDVCNRLGYRGEPSVKVNVQTVSGDITVE